MAHYNAKGEEVPDPNPVPWPNHLKAGPSLTDLIKQMVRTEISQRAAAEDFETFEESDDFDVDEDPDPLSPYELHEGAVEWPGGVKDEDSDPPTDPHGKTAPEGSKRAGEASASGRDQTSNPDQPPNGGNSAARQAPAQAPKS